MTPLVGNRGVIVNQHHFYSRMRNMFGIFVQQIMLLTIYLTARVCDASDNNCASISLSSDADVVV